MITIWKFPLEITDYCEIDLPNGAKILHIGEQDKQLFLWCLIPDSQTTLKNRRKFRVVGTGHPVEEPLDRLKHIGTIQQNSYGREFVWHVFEIISGPIVGTMVFN